jgi:hypothetical protein
MHGARYNVISILGKRVTLVTSHSVDALEMIGACRGHGPVVMLSDLGDVRLESGMRPKADVGGTDLTKVTLDNAPSSAAVTLTG